MKDLTRINYKGKEFIYFTNHGFIGDPRTIPEQIILEHLLKNDKIMTLQELSELLIEKGFADIFDGQVDGDCLDLENMIGSWADRNGEEIIYFDILKVDEESGHLETIIALEAL